MATAMRMEYDAVIIEEDGKPDVRIETDDPERLAHELWRQVGAACFRTAADRGAN